MSLSDFLNTDVETIGSRLGEAGRWWLGEMKGLFGPLLIQRRRTPRLFAERRPQEGYLIGDASGLPAPGDPGNRPVALVLAAGDALIRLMPAPRVPERDIVRTVRLDLDRLMPFPPDAAYHEVALVSGGDATGPLVRLAASPRAAADAELAAALQAGLHVGAVVARAPDGALIDFLPAMQAMDKQAGGRGAWPWAVVTLLVLANIGFAIWRDSRDLQTLQAEVAAQRPAVDRIRSLRQQVETVRSEAHDRLGARLRGEPLAVLDALARDAPRDVEIKRLAWDGATVHLAGTRRNGADVLEALKADPLFANVRNANPDSVAGEGAIDVLADVRPASSRATTP